VLFRSRERPADAVRTTHVVNVDGEIVAPDVEQLLPVVVREVQQVVEQDLHG
jgi:hypothetical protein